MADAATPGRLPRGRHGLSREEVAAAQRLRMLAAMAEAMREKGYVDTTVADVLQRAGVSRESFYQQFGSKLDCFLAAFDLAAEVLIARLRASDAPDVDTADGQDPVDRFERQLLTYLDVLVDDAGFAKLFLVDVHAAGPEAMRRRVDVQEAIVRTVADELGATTDDARFACQMVVAAVATLVTGPLAAGEAERLRALGPPVVAHVRRLAAAGVFG